MCCGRPYFHPGGSGVSEEQVSIISSLWDYSHDSAVQVWFYSKLETDGLPSQAVFITFLQTDCSPHAGLFHFQPGQ